MITENKKKTTQEYWDDYYSRKVYKDVWSLEPSPYCLYVSQFVNEQTKLLEIGCGNGRDTYHFATLTNHVNSIDYSKKGIELCKDIAAQKGFTISFQVLDLYKNEDILRYIENLNTEIDILYVRFLVHAISLKGEANLITLMENLLAKSGKAMLEFRTLGDSRAQVGTAISVNEREDGHYRRFIDPSEFKKRVEKHGKLKVSSYEVSDEFAVFGNERPEVCRMIIRLI